MSVSCRFSGIVYMSDTSVIYLTGFFTSVSVILIGAELFFGGGERGTGT
jgi:hypothetical protein